MTIRSRSTRVAAGTLATLALAVPAASARNYEPAERFAATVGDQEVLVFSTDGRARHVWLRGLGEHEAIVGLDVRPATGVLYAATDADRIYTIDLDARRATPVGSAFAPSLLGEFAGFDFNPAVDRIRLTSDANENLRLVPDTAALAAVDGPLAYAATDASAGIDPSVVGSAYTNPDTDPATPTTLYGIEAATDALVVQNPPNAGTLNTVGKLGVDARYTVGFDIAPGNTGWAVMRPRGERRTGLYRIDLATGAARRSLSFGTLSILGRVLSFGTHTEIGALAVLGGGSKYGKAARHGH